MNGNRKIAVKWTALILALCLTGASRAQTADAPIDKAYHDFARKIERAVSQGNGQLMDAAFDLDILMERMLGGRGISAKTISGIKQGVRQSLDLGRQLNRIVANGGSYKLLKLHRQGNELRALYRLQAEDGLNYHDAVLVKKNGRVRIADIYVFISGEYLSATMRRFALPVITRQEKSPLMKLLTKESEFVKSFPRVMSMTNAVRAGKPVEALGIYDKLPASVQRDKSVMLLRFKAATLKGPGSLEYRKAMVDMEQLFPDDPCLHLLALDLHVLRKEYPKAFKAINAIEKATGDTAYMNFLRGNAYYLQKKPDQAKAALERSVKQEPSLLQAHSSLIILALEAKDWSAVSLRLTGVEKDSGVQLDDLEKMEAFAEYVKTDEYRKWKAARPQPAQDAPADEAGRPERTDAQQ